MWNGVHSILSLLCPWSLDGLRAGQPGLDSQQGQEVFLLHNVQNGSGAHPAFYPMSTGGSFWGGGGVKTFANYIYFYVMP
jgi:hypothetical protein